jgi:arylsulfatase A-like enzyme
MVIAQKLLGAVFVVLGPLALHAAEPARPNILLIYSDDHGRQALSAYGSRVNETPQLDRLARDGVRFDRAFVTNSICTPGRATVLTGLYSHLNGVPVFNAFDGARDHVAKRLQAAGYHTGIVGKWHLGSDPTGFDRWIVLPGQGVYWNPTFLLPGRKLTIQGHCTQITTDLGIEWLKTRPQDQPFFLMLHHKAPHRGWEPDERNRQRFASMKFPETETLWDDYATRPTALPFNQQRIADDLWNSDLKLSPPENLSPSERRAWQTTKPSEVTVDGKTLTGRELVQWKYQRYLQDYLACVQGVDDSVGQLLDFLDTHGLAENTYVIYTSDNGWFLGERGLFDKRFMYEPGMQVPLLIRGPGIARGLTPQQLVTNLDLAPTFLDWAGLPPDAAMQGRSLTPLLRGESPSDWRNSVYYRYYHDPGHHHTAAHLGVRTNDHKLIHYWKKDAYELFDLNRDPNEQHNLLFDPVEAARPEVAALFAGLKQELVRLQREFRDEGKYADASEWPRSSADGPFTGYRDLGQQSVAEAMQMASQSDS